MIPASVLTWALVMSAVTAPADAQRGLCGEFARLAERHPELQYIVLDDQPATPVPPAPEGESAEAGVARIVEACDGDAVQVDDVWIATTRLPRGEAWETFIAALPDGFAEPLGLAAGLPPPAGGQEWEQVRWQARRPMLVSPEVGAALVHVERGGAAPLAGRAVVPLRLGRATTPELVDALLTVLGGEIARVVVRNGHQPLTVGRGLNAGTLLVGYGEPELGITVRRMELGPPPRSTLPTQPARSVLQPPVVGDSLLYSSLALVRPVTLAADGDATAVLSALDGAAGGPVLCPGAGTAQLGLCLRDQPLWLVLGGLSLAGGTIYGPIGDAEEYWLDGSRFDGLRLVSAAFAAAPLPVRLRLLAELMLVSGPMFELTAANARDAAADGPLVVDPPRGIRSLPLGSRAWLTAVTAGPMDGLIQTCCWAEALAAGHEWPALAVWDADVANGQPAMFAELGPAGWLRLLPDEGAAAASARLIGLRSGIVQRDTLNIAGEAGPTRWSRAGVRAQPIAREIGRL